MKAISFALILAFLPHTTVAGEAASAELIGITWKLVKITYSDDTIFKPDDPAKYTLTFQDDGQVAVRIDCNRGYGTWNASASGKLEFGVADDHPGNVSARLIVWSRHTRPAKFQVLSAEGRKALSRPDGRWRYLRIRALNAGDLHPRNHLSHPFSSWCSSLFLDLLWRTPGRKQENKAFCVLLFNRPSKPRTPPTSMA